ncbi:MAG: ABC transporter ATP-binding protein [Sphingobacteriales bacterium]|nr:ABC transporter ATP-binding protein [Sphingobacteriales bacterium]NCT76590.1 ABC transporter ATP-binding protein [Chitinophagaceae bacterium]OJW33530.1 MAG: multidrug ABC transporter ATP-binding protein [Sphingobacteriales bacterium 46-32]
MVNEPIVRTQDLNYSYAAGTPTLQQVNLVVPKGSIYGFLGPNGAGKTTTLRLLLGLLKNQQGSLEIFGQKFPGQRLDILSRIGSLIEQPSLYGHLTATENLEIYRRIYQVDQSRIATVLQLVGLQDTGRKKARQFSLGMKQRLSIAIALLHQPELLILDEPTNGLDPNGIIETRELIKKLNREHNTTVLVSSHILNEVERMATHVGIIHKGKMLFQGTLPELQQMKTKQAALEIETADNARAASLLVSQYAVQETETQLVLPYQSKEETAAINRLLVQAGIDVYAIHARQNDLEQLFIDITSNN